MPKVIYSDVEERERVRRIRSRFLEAQRAGLTQQESVDYANSTGPLPKPKPAAPVRKNDLKFDPDVEHVRFVGMASSEGKVDVKPAETASEQPLTEGSKPSFRDIIPADYEGLPWKDLIALVQKVRPGSPVRSRAQLNSILAEALRS